jgi:hypothetical protein
MNLFNPSLEDIGSMFGVRIDVNNPVHVAWAEQGRDEWEKILWNVLMEGSKTYDKPSS